MLSAQEQFLGIQYTSSGYLWNEEKYQLQNYFEQLDLLPYPQVCLSSWKMSCFNIFYFITSWWAFSREDLMSKDFNVWFCSISTSSLRTGDALLKGGQRLMLSWFLPSSWHPQDLFLCSVLGLICLGFTVSTNVGQDHRGLCSNIFIWLWMSAKV